MPIKVRANFNVCLAGVAMIVAQTTIAQPSAAQTTPNDPPTAVIEVQPDPPTVSTGVILTFSASKSTDVNGGTLTHTWSFGDGQTGSGVQVTHSYAAAGRYTVRLKVTDPQGAFNEASRDVLVRASAMNHDPVAHVATGPRTGTAPASLTFDGRGSYDLDNDPISFDWLVLQGGVVVDQTEGSVATLVFEHPGEFELILRVTDSRGGVNETSPEEVLITERMIDDGDDDDGDGDSGGGEEPSRDIPDSAGQRPSIMCGFGMLGAMLGSVIGLTAMRRRRA